MKTARSARSIRVTTIVAMFVLGGCHRATAPSTAAVNSNPAATAVVGRAFGDSVAHAVRVLSFDRQTEAANVYVKQPDNVIVLGVEPGRDIEVIFPGSMNAKKLRAANTFEFDMRRFEISTRSSAQAAAAQRQAYQACKVARENEIRAEARQRRDRRDTTGKLKPGGSGQSDIIPRDCDMLDAPGKKSVYTAAMSPRQSRERYLVVLSSSSPITPAELEERMAGLSTIAPDIALTIEAIAAGIYAGRPGTWGGTYVSW